MLDFLCRRFPAISSNLWMERLAAGKVRSETGAALAATYPCRAGERFFYFREVTSEPLVPGVVEIVLEREHYLIADKPPGLPVHSTGPYVRETLLGRLERELGLGDLAAAHRLDLETSGLVLVVKHREFRGLYQELFARGEVERVYEALANVPEEPEVRRWRVENRLERGEPFFRMRVVPGEVNARTDIELLSWADGIGHFRLRPETGKKHQLRLHMAGLGFPIVGDRYDRDPKPKGGHGGLGGHGGPPLRLLARRLGFRDPVTGEVVEAESGRDLHVDWEGDLNGVSLAADTAFR